MFQSKNSQGRFWLYHCMYCLRICLRLNTYKNISTYTKLVTAYVCPLVIGERIRKPSLEMFTDMRFMSFMCGQRRKRSQKKGAYPTRLREVSLLLQSSWGPEARFSTA